MTTTAHCRDKEHEHVYWLSQEETKAGEEYCIKHRVYRTYSCKDAECEEHDLKHVASDIVYGENASCRRCHGPMFASSKHDRNGDPVYSRIFPT
jgi:hypothetical protein